MLFSFLKTFCRKTFLFAYFFGRLFHQLLFEMAPLPPQKVRRVEFAYFVFFCIFWGGYREFVGFDGAREGPVRSKTKLPEVCFAGRSNVGKSSLLNKVCQ